MSVVARRVAAIPARKSVETWRAIVGLLAEHGSAAHAELEAVTNVGAMLIAEEHTSTAPIVVTTAAGPRVRIYTVHGTDAADALEDELPLAIWPLTEPGWAVSLPCAVEDLDDVAAALTSHAQITVRDAADGAAVQADGGQARGAAPLYVDIEEMERP